MEYSIVKIATVAECTMLLDKIKEDHKEINFQKMAEERTYDKIGKDGSELVTAIATLNAEIIGTEHTISNLAPGPAKTQYERKLTRLSLRKWELEGHYEKYNVIARINKELAISMLENQITETINLTGIINRRMTEL